jgi:hypothetical protein
MFDFLLLIRVERQWRPDQVLTEATPRDILNLMAGRIGEQIPPGTLPTWDLFWSMVARAGLTVEELGVVCMAYRQLELGKRMKEPRTVSALVADFTRDEAMEITGKTAAAFYNWRATAAGPAWSVPTDTDILLLARHRNVSDANVIALLTDAAERRARRRTDAAARRRSYKATDDDAASNKRRRRRRRRRQTTPSTPSTPATRTTP